MRRRKQAKIIKPIQYEVDSNGELLTVRHFGWVRRKLRGSGCNYYGFTGDRFQNFAVLHCGHPTALYPYYIIQYIPKPFIINPLLELKYALLIEALPLCVDLLKPDLITID